MEMNIEGKDPWDWMQPYDVRRFGEVILDRVEQERWCRAVLVGWLPYMWRKAAVAKQLIYDRLGLRAGDKVLVIGEFPYFSPGDLTQAFSGLVANPGTFVWKGVEIFWGAKP